jgi:Restriction endonuclease
VKAWDVSARMMFAGVPVLWIVECKLWNRAVPKEKASVLKDIVNDLGADRGLLMSERGFQSGAVNLAAAKNITLSSLDELRANATEQLMQSRVRIETR